ncbi:transposase, partial [Merismopedia glauca]|uniref:transposase n=1 Tax=Merismopedia glauca TaxID=292586 RepID=UPI001C62B99E
TVMELLDALSGNQNAKSVAELSLSPLFRRDYNSLYKGIQDFLPPPEQAINEASQDNLLSVVSATVPPPFSRSFYLFGLDVTPYPRPHSGTLEDKKYIYQPNQIKGNKPINIGHSYSVLAALPEHSEPDNSSWVIPLLGERVSSQQKDSDVAQKQVRKIFSLPSVPWQDHLSVLVADSVYSQRSFLSAQVQLEQLVTITRARSNRVFYRQFVPQDEPTDQLGHPRWFGDKFDLKDDTTWGEPHQVVCSTFMTSSGTTTLSENLWMEADVNERN